MRPQPDPQAAGAPTGGLGPDPRPRPRRGYVPFQASLRWPCPACAWHHPWILLLLTPQSLMKAHNLLFIPQNPAYISLLLPLRGGGGGGGSRPPLAAQHSARTRPSLPERVALPSCWPSCPSLGSLQAALGLVRSLTLVLSRERALRVCLQSSPVLPAPTPHT